MPTASYPIYDADRHFYEPPEAFLDNLPKSFQKDFQYVQINGRTKLAVAGQISDYIPNPTFEVVAAPGAHEAWYRGDNPKGLSFREITGKAIGSQEAFHNGDAHLKTMDQQGIHAGLVLPTLASVIEARLGQKPDTIAALFHSLNQWTVENVGLQHQNRLFPVSMINLSDVNLAIKELEYVLAHGARVVGVRPAPVPGRLGSRSMGFTEFDPFWARINEAGIFVVLHVSDSGYDQVYRWWTEGRTDEWKPFEKDTFQEVMDLALTRPIYDTMAALICHGVFERFPNIRVASLENGTRWLQPLIHQLEDTYRRMPKSFAENPVETLRRHVFISPFYEESLRDIVDIMGSNRVLFGSDWPHPEGLATPLDYYHDTTKLSDSEVRDIMSNNLKGLLEGLRN